MGTPRHLPEPTRPPSTCSPSTSGERTPEPTETGRSCMREGPRFRAEWLETMWKEKLAEFNKRPKAKLPKWCGVRPGRKEGDPETPEGEEEEAEEEEAEEE